MCHGVDLISNKKIHALFRPPEMSKKITQQKYFMKSIEWAINMQNNSTAYLKEKKYMT